MALKRSDIPLLFKRTIIQYLEEKRPKFKNNRFPLSEKDIQKQFAGTLIERNIPFMRERQYSVSDHKRTDFVLYDEVAMLVEIEWEAKQHDGFAKRTFEDLHKLDLAKPGTWGMFLAVNIGGKYERPRGEVRCADPSGMALSRITGNATLLSKKWKEATDRDLLKCNPRFWYWPFDKHHTVTVLTCYGRRLRNGWSAE